MALVLRSDVIMTFAPLTHLWLCMYRTLRMLTVLSRCARLRMLMAWCSTLGGAHSQLGDTLPDHVSGREVA